MTVYVLRNSEGLIIAGAMANISSEYMPLQICDVEALFDAELCEYDWQSLNDSDVLRVRLREDYKDILKLRAAAEYDAEIDALVCKYPLGERMTWPQKVAESKTWLAMTDEERDANIDAYPLLRYESLGTKQSMTDLAERIINNHTYCAENHAAATRRMYDKLKQIDALSTIDEVKNYLGA